MWKARILIALGFALTCSAAQAQRVGQRLVIQPPINPAYGVQIARPDAPLLIQTARSEQHARLLAPVRTTIKRAMSANQVDIAEGSILHGASMDGAIFCSPLKGNVGACLEDTDNDGRFDVIYDAAMDVLYWNYLAFHADGNVSPGVFSRPQRLASPVPYVLADTGQALTAPVEVFLWSNHRPGSPERSAKAELQVYLGTPKARAMRANSGPFKVEPLSGGRASVLGAEIDILGFDADGAVQYRVRRPIPVGPDQVSVTPF